MDDDLAAVFEMTADELAQMQARVADELAAALIEHTRPWIEQRIDLLGLAFPGTPGEQVIGAIVSATLRAAAVGVDTDMRRGGFQRRSD